jgi:hypothetical protein
VRHRHVQRLAQPAAAGQLVADLSAPGNAQATEVAGSRPLQVRGSGVFWPVAADPLSRLNDASDHHLVWVDLRVR